MKTLEETETHRIIDGRKSARVTHILKSCGLIDYSQIDKSTMDFALDRGGKIHKTCELWDIGELDESTLDPQLQPYLEAYKKFLKETRFEVLAIEQQVESEILGISGRIDRIGLLNDRRCILDIKTTSVPDWTAIQTALYALCLDQFYLVDRYGLALRNNGTYRLDKFQNQSDKPVALAAVTLYQWKQEDKL